MTKSEALNTLMKMRAWRRCGKGEQNEKDRPEMPEQKEVDEAFDVCIEMLSKSSLPSNLDEAAKTYGNEHIILPDEYNDGDIPYYEEATATVFKAGAKWMAGRFVLVRGEPTGWFRANDGSEYATGLDLEDPIKLPADFYVRKK